MFPLDAATTSMVMNLFTSLAVGLAIGTERATNSNAPKKVGMRDFALISLLAFITSLFRDEAPVAWLLAFATVSGFSLAIFVVENTRVDTKPVGTTTLLALPLTFAVASLPNFNISFWMVATIVFLLLLLLSLKAHVHSFINTLERREISDFAILIGIAVSITPLIPPGAKLPVPLLDFSGEAMQVTYRYIGVEALWKVVVMVSLMSFMAHFITKYAKGKNALILATFMGGLVSSLATILMLLNNNKTQPQQDTNDGGSLTRKEIFLGFVAANTGSILKDIIIFRTFVGEEKFAIFPVPINLRSCTFHLDDSVCIFLPA